MEQRAEQSNQSKDKNWQTYHNKKTKAPIRSYRCVGQLVKYLPAVAASKSQRIMPRSATALDPLSRQRDWLCPRSTNAVCLDVKSKGVV